MGRPRRNAFCKLNGSNPYRRFADTAVRHADSRFRIEHYGKTPHFALYEHDALLTLTPYKKGAQNVVRRMTQLLERIEELEETLQAVSPPGTCAVERLQTERQAADRRQR